MQSQVPSLPVASHLAHWEIYIPNDVDGWVVGLKESLGIMLWPAGAIFLVIFGGHFLSAYQCLLQL